MWGQKEMNKLKWGEGVVEEDFSRDGICVASWKMPRSFPDERHECGVTHFVLREKQEQRQGNGKNIVCLTKNTTLY